MKSHSNWNKCARSAGVTLIEAIIYIALVSCLMSGFISYAYAINQQNQSLFDDIESAQTS